MMKRETKRKAPRHLKTRKHKDRKKEAKKRGLLGYALCLMLLSVPAYADNPDKGSYIAATKAQEWKHDVPRGLLTATCEQESRWNPDAVSEKGALGLCQIMPRTLIDIIQRFQLEQGLDPDGVIGPKTWEAMRPGVPYRRQTMTERLLDPYQNIEFAAMLLDQIRRYLSEDPVIMMGIYYGGPGHHMVKYQREVMKRWENRED